MSLPGQHVLSGIKDNHSRGTVGDVLRSELRAGADLDIVSAYFTVFAHDKLKAQLDNLGHIRLLFGEAAFIKNLDPEHKDGAAYVLRALSSGLNQRHIAQACAAWIRDRVEVCSVSPQALVPYRRNPPRPRHQPIPCGRPRPDIRGSVQHLTPLCPNCHRIAHAKPGGGVFSVAELRAALLPHAQDSK